MDATNLTELIKAIGELKAFALSGIVVLVGLWIGAALIRSWWAYRTKSHLERQAREDKHEQIRREEEREKKLGDRLDKINDRTLTLCETTLKANTEALQRVASIIDCTSDDPRCPLPKNRK